MRRLPLILCILLAAACIVLLIRSQYYRDEGAVRLGNRRFDVVSVRGSVSLRVYSFLRWEAQQPGLDGYTEEHIMLPGFEAGDAFTADPTTAGWRFWGGTYVEVSYWMLAIAFCLPSVSLLRRYQRTKAGEGFDVELARERKGSS